MDMGVLPVHDRASVGIHGIYQKDIQKPFDLIVMGTFRIENVLCFVSQMQLNCYSYSLISTIG